MSTSRYQLDLKLGGFPLGDGRLSVMTVCTRVSGFFLNYVELFLGFVLNCVESCKSCVECCSMCVRVL